jgi:hypothetical protein
MRRSGTESVTSILEAGYGKKDITRIVKFVGDDPSRFRELVLAVFSADETLSRRAAWAISYAAADHPQLVKPYCSRLVKYLGKPGNHPAIDRNILRLFESVPISGSVAVKLFDYCLSVIPYENHTVAVRAFAITVAARIASMYPELGAELRSVIETIPPADTTAALKVRSRDALKLISGN